MPDPINFMPPKPKEKGIKFTPVELKKPSAPKTDPAKGKGKGTDKATNASPVKGKGKESIPPRMGSSVFVIEDYG
ncbi:hypothetical protein U1Q18_011151 [Sarracenia purpurea var. burkii]